jgi:hypothetical protein
MLMVTLNAPENQHPCRRRRDRPFAADYQPSVPGVLAILMTAQRGLGKQTGRGKARKIANLRGDLPAGRWFAIVSIFTASETVAVMLT